MRTPIEMDTSTFTISINYIYPVSKSSLCAVAHVRMSARDIVLHDTATEFRLPNIGSSSMRISKSTIALVLSSASLFCGAPLAMAATASVSSTQPSPGPGGKLTADYSAFAGSTSNAQALVTGLRDGTSVTLTSTTPGVPSASFAPATGKLGYGNVNIALSLAKADLAKQGISNPTPAQLAAALNGGTVATPAGTATLAGVLSQRSSGMGWGQIANTMGVHLGALVSDSKSSAAAGKKADVTSKSDTGRSLASHENSGKSLADAGNKGASGNAGGNGGGNAGGGNGGGNGGGKK